MRIAVGCDHRGLGLKRAVISLVEELGHQYEDFGCHRPEPVDYPDIALKVATAVATGGFDRGVLVCSTGIGMCMAANKVGGIRAALCDGSLAARRSREHNDANILCLGEEVTGEGLAREIVRLFLDTPFEGGRHQQRLNKIAAMEGKCSASR